LTDSEAKTIEAIYREEFADADTQPGATGK